MHASLVLSALFAVGALSVPLSPRAVVYTTHVKVEVVTVTEPPGWKPPKTTTTTTTTTTPTPTPTPHVLLQQSSTSTHHTTSTTTPAAVIPPKQQPSPSPSPAPAPAPAHVAQAPSDGSPVVGGVSMLSTLNQWRSAYSLNGFTWSPSLAGNSAQTGQLNHGFTEDHHLFSGSYAQVITPCFTDGSLPSSSLGGKSPFWYAMTALLCEVPGDNQLGGQCPSVNDFMGIRDTETGHHDILTSSKYTSAGCSYTPNPNGSGRWSGLCVCDFS